MTRSINGEERLIPRISRAHLSCLLNDYSGKSAASAGPSSIPPTHGLPHVLTRCGCHKSTACIDEWASSSLLQGRLLAAEPTDVRFKRSYPQWHKTRTTNGLRRCGPVLLLKVTAERMPVGIVSRDAIPLLGIFVASKKPRASADLRDWVGNQRDAAPKRPSERSESIWEYSVTSRAWIARRSERWGCARRDY